MKVGFILPNIGHYGGADTVKQAAQRAEQLGYDSVWVTDRLLWPLEPQTHYGGTPDGRIPDPYKHSLDPVATLSYAAAHTSRIRLGTSVLDIPFYNPVALARALTTVDVLSNGRLHVGLGLGWSADEYQAAGQQMKGRGKRATEFIEVLKVIWTQDPVEFQGEFFSVPRSVILPKPVQKPHPPLSLAAYAPGSFKRAATLTNAWHPADVPPRAMPRMLEQIRGFAAEAGRDPADIQVVVRANLYYSENPSTAERRPPFTGNDEQIASDLQALRDLDVAEVFFDPTFSEDGQSFERYLARMEAMRTLAG